jgi:nitroreductase/NAD-dependent dihydropyrimidine dehydrogenase PreA subunit
MAISIDTDKCHKDGLCALVCPTRLITMEGADGFPAPVAEMEKICLDCGHCLAVCPHEALSLNGVGPGQCAPLEGPGLSPEQLAAFLKGRRSIRRYKDQPLERSTIERLLDLARYAPSGHNLQPVNWLVISGRGQLDQLAGVVAQWMRYVVENHPEIAEPMHLARTLAKVEAGEDLILRGAPHLAVAYGEKDNRLAPTPCIIALAYLELAAHGLGLGACWAGYFNAAATTFPPMQEVLDLPQGMVSFGAMMLGRPQYRYQRIPPRNPARVTWR